MELQVDAKQQYELNVIAAITDLFDAQSRETPDYAIVEMRDWIEPLFAGNDQLKANAVQTFRTKGVVKFQTV